MIIVAEREDLTSEADGEQNDKRIFLVVKRQIKSFTKSCVRGKVENCLCSESGTFQTQAGVPHILNIACVLISVPLFSIPIPLYFIYMFLPTI